MTGVTIRTLHYYDQIGLLRPETVTDAGYRLYGEKDMERLSQILFFRELDFPLSQIKEMLDSPSFDRNEALRAQHELLKKKKERLERLIALTERIMEGEKEMSFQEFDSSEIERARKNMQRKPKNAGAIPRPGRRVKTHGRLQQRGMGGSDEGKRFHHAGFCAEQGACAGV